MNVRGAYTFPRHDRGTAGFPGNDGGPVAGAAAFSSLVSKLGYRTVTAPRRTGEPSCVLVAPAPTVIVYLPRTSFLAFAPVRGTVWRLPSVAAGTIRRRAACPRRDRDTRTKRAPVGTMKDALSLPS